MSRIRLLVVWLIMAALPLQGFAAVTMLFCPAQEAEHVHALNAGVGAAQDQDQDQDQDSADNCGVCASCCHSVMIGEFVPASRLARLPRADIAEPVVLIQVRATPVPDKPPRA